MCVRTNRVQTQDEPASFLICLRARARVGVIHITFNRSLKLPCHRGGGRGRGRGGDDEDEDGSSKAARSVTVCVCASVCGVC